jgi:Ubiquitin family
LFSVLSFFLFFQCFLVGLVLVSIFASNESNSITSSSATGLFFIAGVDAASPPTSSSVVSTVQVSLKGKKYEIQDVATVEELQERLEEASGVAPSKQGRILFQGKTLAKANDGKSSLVEAGVKSGDVLNCVPAGSSGSTSGKKKKKTALTSAAKKSTANTAGSSKSVTSSAAAKLSDELSTLTGGKNPEDMSPDEIKAALKAAGVDTDKLDEANQRMTEMLQQAGVDTSKMEDMVKNMMSGDGGGGGLGGLFGGKPPSMEDSMDMMNSMMNSPLFSQLMNDPEKLEESRQMILKNPMMKSMLDMNPQISQILNDPVAWRESMQAAAKMYQEMDKDELLSAMKEGAAAAAANGGLPPGMPPGLFGDGAASAASTTTPSALDELDEDD